MIYIAESATGLGAVPKGAILLWSGTIASIPSGYALCNGANGTPDLRDKFVVCATSDSGGVAKSNITGSLLQSQNTKTHTHTFSVISDSNNAADQQTCMGPGDDTDHAWATDQHQHSVYGTTASTQHVPPFYALAYIMRL